MEGNVLIVSVSSPSVWSSTSQRARTLQHFLFLVGKEVGQEPLSQNEAHDLTDSRGQWPNETWGSGRWASPAPPFLTEPSGGSLGVCLLRRRRGEAYVQDRALARDCFLALLSLSWHLTAAASTLGGLTLLQSSV